MAADFDRLLDKALREGFTAPRLGSAFGGTDDITALPRIVVKRHTAVIPVSTEQALDAGLITEDEARAQGWTPCVLPPLLWRHRVRRRWWEWRERFGRKVGGWIAGVDLTERDDDY